MCYGLTSCCHTADHRKNEMRTPIATTMIMMARMTDRIFCFLRSLSTSWVICVDLANCKVSLLRRTNLRYIHSVVATGVPPFYARRCPMLVIAIWVVIALATILLIMDFFEKTGWPQ
jgi:hypothetical protein